VTEHFLSRGEFGKFIPDSSAVKPGMTGGFCGGLDSRKPMSKRALRVATTVPLERLHGLAPIFDARARVLILGSFPSVASLEAGQYYAHPRILGALIDRPLATMPYAQRLDHVRDAGIAIWDVFASCARPGSLDTAIRDPIFNDIARLLRDAPQLTTIGFNGGLAGKQAQHLLSGPDLIRLRSVVLPSTSPAHAGRSLVEKLALWRAGLASALPEVS
jgi:hypoxanthine-DNA glycosylase